MKNTFHKEIFIKMASRSDDWERSRVLINQTKQLVARKDRDVITEEELKELFLRTCSKSFK